MLKLSLVNRQLFPSMSKKLWTSSKWSHRLWIACCC